MYQVFLTAAGAAASAGEGQNGSGNMIVLVAYIVVFGLLAYFFMIKPQKKERQRMESMLASLEVGDTVLTTSGFYGTCIGIDDDTIVVEFGGNKNCRIPMKKDAVAQIEKPEG